MNNKKRIYFGLDTAPYWLIIMLFLVILGSIYAIINIKDTFTRVCIIYPLILVLIAEYNAIKDKLLNRKTEYLYEIIIENDSIKIVNKIQTNKTINTYKLDKIGTFLYKIVVKDNKKDMDHQIYINNELVARRTYLGIGKYTNCDPNVDKIINLAKYIDCFEFKIEEPAEKFIMGFMGYKNEFTKNINKCIKKLRNDEF